MHRLMAKRTNCTKRNNRANHFTALLVPMKPVCTRHLNRTRHTHRANGHAYAFSRFTALCRAFPTLGLRVRESVWRKYVAYVVRASRPHNAVHGAHAQHTTRAPHAPCAGRVPGRWARRRWSTWNMGAAAHDRCWPPPSAHASTNAARPARGKPIQTPAHHRACPHFFAGAVAFSPCICLAKRRVAGQKIKAKRKGKT